MVHAMKMDAKLSSCYTYRYYLTRQWDETLPFVNFIGLNPSTADASINDPTIYKCIRYAKKWAYGGIIMTNLFAYRTKNPSVMLSYEGDKVGQENNKYLLKGKNESALSIAAWGNDGIHKDRWMDIIKLGSRQLKEGVF